jgi:hypothetical protein
MRLTFEQHAEQIASLYRAPAVGRPAGLANATLVRTLLECVAAGNYMEIAAHIVGMSKQTIYNWLKRGEQGEPPYDQFLDAYQKASAVAEVAAVAAIRAAGAAGPEYWLASQTFLERRFPERWARRQGRETGPEVVVQIGATREALAIVERQVRVVEAREQPADEKFSPPADPPVGSGLPVTR